jgi:predicted phage replisome organizer
LIESLPEADSIIVIWFKLLCLAGKQNNSGVFTMNGKIPYTDRMLATIFRRKDATVQLALKTFEQFGMVEIIDDVITIPNWGKHQNLDSIEAKKEYMRGYMSQYRGKQKLIAACKANSKTNSKANVSQADIEREEDIDKKENIDISSDKPKPAPKETYGEFSNVKLTIEEYQKLINLLGTQTQSYIDRLDGYIASKGAKYKSHYATILNWYRKDEKDRPQKTDYSDPDRYKNAESEDNPFG